MPHDGTPEPVPRVWRGRLNGPRLLPAEGRPFLNHMVENSPASNPLDTSFAALADPTRRDVVARLAALPPGGTLPVTTLAAPYAMSLQAVSKHPRVLEGANLIAWTKSGRVRRCRPLPEPLRAAAAWIETHRAFWEERLDTLGRFLATPDAAETADLTRACEDEGEDR